LYRGQIFATVHCLISFKARGAWRRHVPASAEITPFEPDPGSAGEGKRSIAVVALSRMYRKSI
jgi:hypothetical protein